MPKKQVVLSQINTVFGAAAFIPFSSGMLWAYAKSLPEISEAYELVDYIYVRENVEEAVKRMGKVDVFGGSLYSWNNSITLAFAKAFKEANSYCLVVLGGPYVPNKSEGYFLTHPYIDLLVHNEGEITFAEVLKQQLYGRPRYEAVQGLSFKNPDGSTTKNVDRTRLDNLDVLPSPYLEGCFDDLPFGRYEFAPSSEGSRGCPYSCT